MNGDSQLHSKKSVQMPLTMWASHNHHWNDTLRTISQNYVLQTKILLFKSRQNFSDVINHVWKVHGSVGLTFFY